MKLIVAVSGGIDSVVLLKKLIEENTHELIVAHVDHGIRDDSDQDASFVGQLAATYGLQYEQTKLHLGERASEEQARMHRYKWLHEVRDKHGADAIATAHHQDDVIETMIINLLRGTGWRGLCSLREHDRIVRPLLTLSKAEIIHYALSNGLEWRGDSTNDDVRYLRNYVRFRYTQAMDQSARKAWIALYEKQAVLADLVEVELDQLRMYFELDNMISRYKLILSGRKVFGQVVQRAVGMSLERSVIDQLWHFTCTAKPEKRFRIAGVDFRVTARDLIVSTSDV